MTSQQIIDKLGLTEAGDYDPPIYISEHFKNVEFWFSTYPFGVLELEARIAICGYYASCRIHPSLIENFDIPQIQLHIRRSLADVLADHIINTHLT